VRSSGESGIISLDGADVDNDICTFLRHSFKELGCRHPDFPQPSEVDLAKLASRAGRRFLVASTMMKFIIDDEDNDPHDRLELMLELTSSLLPGTEVYKLYDCILSVCRPKAGLHALVHCRRPYRLTSHLANLVTSWFWFGKGCADNVDTATICHGYPYRQHSPREYLSLVRSRLCFRPFKLRPPSST
jgi:hypothetical protein